MPNGRRETTPPIFLGVVLVGSGFIRNHRLGMCTELFMFYSDGGGVAAKCRREAAGKSDKQNEKVLYRTVYHERYCFSMIFVFIMYYKYVLQVIIFKLKLYVPIKTKFGRIENNFFYTFYNFKISIVF